MSNNHNADRKAESRCLKPKYFSQHTWSVGRDTENRQNTLCRGAGIINSITENKGPGMPSIFNSSIMECRSINQGTPPGDHQPGSILCIRFFSSTIGTRKVTAAVVAETSVVAVSSPAVATVVPEAMRSSKVSTNFGKLALAEDLTCEGKHRSKRECTQRRTIIVGFTTHLSMSVSLSVACVVCVSSRPFVGLPSFLVCSRCLYCKGEWVPFVSVCVCHRAFRH